MKRVAHCNKNGLVCGSDKKRAAKTTRWLRGGRRAAVETRMANCVCAWVRNVRDRDLCMNSEAEWQSCTNKTPMWQTGRGSHWEAEREEIKHKELNVRQSRSVDCWMAVRLTGIFSHFKAHCEIYCHLMTGRHITIIAICAFTPKTEKNAELLCHQLQLF